MTAEQIAQAFHEAYERLAPDFGYKTREASAKPWDEVPEQNKSLMIAVVQSLMDSGILLGLDSGILLGAASPERSDEDRIGEAIAEAQRDAALAPSLVSTSNTRASSGSASR